MNTRAAFVLVALLVIAGRTPAGSADKAKLRELAQLPNISVSVGMAVSTISGFRFGEKIDHMAEIARLQKQMKGDPSDAERYVLLGRHYNMAMLGKEAKEAWSKAIAICRQQVREHPDDMNWLIRLGEALAYNDEMKEGEALLRRAVKEDPHKWRGWLALAYCVECQANRTIFGDKSFSCYGRRQQLIIPSLVEQKPTEQQIVEMRRLWKEARCYYDRAVDLAPRDEAKPYHHRWSASHYHATIDMGLHTIKGEEVNPRAAPLTPECIADIRQIARLSFDDPEVIGLAVFCELGACVYQNKIQLRENLSSWADYLAVRNRSLVDVLPEESRTFVNWCLERMEELTKHPDKAKAAAASEIMAIWLTGMTDLGEQLGVSYPNSIVQEKAKGEAIENLRTAVHLDPARDRAWDLLTLLLRDEKKTDEAIAVARRRIAVKDNVHNRYFLAKVYADSAQFDKSAEELHVALKIDPKDLNCRLGLIALALKRDNAQSLKEAGEQLEAVWPRIKEAKNGKLTRDYYLLSGLHLTLTDQRMWARGAFEQVLQLKKGEPTVTRALAAFGEPLGPADQYLAIDYIKERGGRVGRIDGQAAPPVECIYLNRGSITDEDLFVLTAFPQLRELELEFAQITDAGLSQLAQLTSIRSLDLDSTKITDKGLIHLKSLRGLRDLSLSHTPITDAGLSHLEAFQELEKLRITGADGFEEREPITDAGLAHLRKLPKLQSVTVGSAITDKGLAHLAAIPHLRRLLMLSSKITDEGMPHLERLAELEALWLSGAEITDAGLVHLKGLRKLKKLHLGGTKITDAGLVHLKELSQLEELELDSTAVSDAGLAHLRGLTNLQKLNLGDSDRKKASLTGSKKPPLTGKGLKHLQGLTKLKYLDLDGRPITDSGLCDIEKLTQVEYLSLDTTSITDEGLAYLHPLKQLQLVNVKSTKVTRQGIAELRKALPKLEVYR